MSDETTKFTVSRRRQKTDTHIEKQIKIAKQHNKIPEYNRLVEDQPHRFAKHHAMDCGNPQCPLCGNPRKISKDKLTYQEKRDTQLRLFD